MNGCEVDMSEQEPVLEQCDYMHLHEKVIEQVQEEMPEEEILYDLVVGSRATTTLQVT